MTLLPLLAAISGDSLLQAVVWLVVAALIYFVANWGIERIGIPEPFHKIAIALIVLAVMVILINALLVIAGHPLVRF